jgi:hypothetical protein
MLQFIYTFFHILVRVYVFAKVFYLMCMTYYYPESYPLSVLTWWIYFLIFDIWLEVILPTKIENKSQSIDEKNEESL